VTFCTRAPRVTVARTVAPARHGSNALSGPGQSLRKYSRAMKATPIPINRKRFDTTYGRSMSPTPQTKGHSVLLLAIHEEAQPNGAKHRTPHPTQALLCSLLSPVSFPVRLPPRPLPRRPDTTGEGEPRKAAEQTTTCTPLPGESILYYTVG